MGEFMGICHKATMTTGIIPSATIETQTLHEVVDVGLDVQVWYGFATDKMMQTDDLENLIAVAERDDDLTEVVRIPPGNQPSSPEQAIDEQRIAEDKLVEGLEHPNEKVIEEASIQIPDLDDVMKSSDFDPKIDEILERIMNSHVILAGASGNQLDIPPNTPELGSPGRSGGMDRIQEDFDVLPPRSVEPAQTIAVRKVSEMAFDVNLTDQGFIDEYLTVIAGLESEKQRDWRCLIEKMRDKRDVDVEMKKMVIKLLASERKMKVNESEFITRVKRRLRGCSIEIEQLKEEVAERRVDVEDVERQMRGLLAENQELARLLNYNEKQVKQFSTRAIKNKEILTETKEKNSRMMALLKQVSQKLLLGAIQEQPPESEMASPQKDAAPTIAGFSLRAVPRINVETVNGGSPPKIIVSDSSKDAIISPGTAESKDGVMSELKEYLYAEDTARDISEYSSDGNVVFVVSCHGL
jgi:hypothetical protein